MIRFNRYIYGANSDYGIFLILKVKKKSSMRKCKIINIIGKKITVMGINCKN